MKAATAQAIENEDVTQGGCSGRFFDVQAVLSRRRLVPAWPDLRLQDLGPAEVAIMWRSLAISVALWIAVFRLRAGGAADDRVEARIAMDDGGGAAGIVGGQVAGEQFVKHHADGEDVGPVIDGMWRVDNFRCGVVGRAEDFLAFLGLGIRRVGRVRNRRFSAGRSRSSRMLAGLMSRWRMPCSWAWASPSQMPVTRRMTSAGIDGDAVGRVEERLPGDILHDDEEHAVDFAEIVNADEIGVVQAGHRLGFGFEAGAERGVVTEFLRQDLDGDGAVERFLDGTVNRAHAAGGDQAIRFRSPERAARVPRVPAPERRIA